MALDIYGHMLWTCWIYDVDGLVQDYSNSSALAMELLRSCTTPSTYLVLCWGGVIGTLHIDGFAQDCGNPNASAMELPQSCTKPLVWLWIWCRTSIYLTSATISHPVVYTGLVTRPSATRATLHLTALFLSSESDNATLRINFRVCKGTTKSRHGNKLTLVWFNIYMT